MSTSASNGFRDLLVERIPLSLEQLDALEAHYELLVRWNRVFQAISVGPGEHTLVFQYRSRGLLPGAAIGMAAAAALVLAVGYKPKSYCKPP